MSIEGSVDSDDESVDVGEARRKWGMRVGRAGIATGAAGLWTSAGNTKDVGEGEGLRGDLRRTKVEIGVIAGRSESIQGFCPRRKGLSDRGARDARTDG